MQYYKPTAVVELLNLFHADNQATHLESSWEYKLDRYTSLPSRVLGPFLNVVLLKCRTRLIELNSFLARQ